jgi:hypothetical protein
VIAALGGSVRVDEIDFVGSGSANTPDLVEHGRRAAVATRKVGDDDKADPFGKERAKVGSRVETDADTGDQAERSRGTSGEPLECRLVKTLPQVGEIEMRNEPPSEDRVHKRGILFASAHHVDFLSTDRRVNVMRGWPPHNDPLRSLTLSQLESVLSMG